MFRNQHPGHPHILTILILTTQAKVREPRFLPRSLPRKSESQRRVVGQLHDEGHDFLDKLHAVVA